MFGYESLICNRGWKKRAMSLISQTQDMGIGEFLLHCSFAFDTLSERAYSYSHERRILYLLIPIA